MQEILMGTILGGSLLLSVMIYPATLAILYMSAKNKKTNSRGIKNLKFQEFNHTWKKFVR